jgi:hypothetical protein
MKICNGLFIIVLLTFNVACDTDLSLKSENSKKALENAPFFNINSFFEKEITNTLIKVDSVYKTVTVNGKAESKNIVVKDWKEELSPFINADINRPAWHDKYLKKETILADNSIQKEYYALMDILKTRNIIVRQNSEATHLSILNQEKTLSTDNTTQLIYETGKGYTIKTTQRLLNSVDTIIIDAKFVND